MIASTDASGTTTRYSYGPYGESTSWSGSRFRYTGQIAIPEVSLCPYKSRVYAPALGRFLQTDPIGKQCKITGDGVTRVPNQQRREARYEFPRTWSGPSWLTATC